MSAGLHTLNGRVAIVGGGVAGLMAALPPRAAPGRPRFQGAAGRRSLDLVGAGRPRRGAGDGRQPGAARRRHRSPRATGSAWPEIVERFTRAAPEAVKELARLGVAFDRTRDGGFALGLEAAHGRRRIAHAGGDGTGRELMRALVAAALRTPSIRALEDSRRDGSSSRTEPCADFSSSRRQGR